MLCFLLLLFFSTAKLSVGLVKFEVIPPTSSDSPFYVGHVPFWEMINVSIQHSISRENYIVSMQNNTDTQHIGLESVYSSQISHQRSSGLYAVRLQIGTPAKTYFLALDTASNIIWLQCSECSDNHACFQHDAPLFKCGGSETCHPFICTIENEKDVCKSKGHCERSRCSYGLGFYDKSYTEGYFATETFTFDTNYRVNLVFGCGTKQQGFNFFGNPNYIAGVMGMSRASTSLPKQLGAGIFSHCLPSEVSPSRTSFLSFGSEIPTGGFATAPLLIRTDMYKRMYTVGLTGISINSEPGVAVGNALAMIDTGTRLTVLAPIVFHNLKLIVNGHFLNNENIEGRIQNPQLLCYKWKTQPRNPYENLPHINFYLGTAVFQIKPDAAFHVDDNDFSRFCLWMRLGHTDITIIGARALTNHHIIYDTRRNQNLLYFKPHTC